MRVLIVEDDRALGLFLKKGLALEGHEVDWVGDGESGLAQAVEAQPDLMVLDLNLPRRDGIEVLREVRDLSPDTAVLVLTGRSQVEERIRCLNMGADDCLLKPFSFHELAARCRAVFRRRERSADSILRYGAVTMNLVRREVTRDGQPVDLTAKEFALLEFLLRRRGECASREELLREVWQMPATANTNVVDVYINYLRKKMAAAHPDGTASPAVVETLRGSGYRLAGTGQRPQTCAVRENDGFAHLARGA